MKQPWLLLIIKQRWQLVAVLTKTRRRWRHCTVFSGPQPHSGARVTTELHFNSISHGNKATLSQHTRDEPFDSRNGVKEQSSSVTVSSAGASRCTALGALVAFPHSQRLKTQLSTSCNTFVFWRVSVTKSRATYWCLRCTVCWRTTKFLIFLKWVRYINVCRLEGIPEIEILFPVRCYSLKVFTYLNNKIKWIN